MAFFVVALVVALAVLAAWAWRADGGKAKKSTRPRRELAHPWWPRTWTVAVIQHPDGRYIAYAYEWDARTEPSPTLLSAVRCLDYCFSAMRADDVGKERDSSYRRPMGIEKWRAIVRRSVYTSRGGHPVTRREALDVRVPP